jgi:hypothetical protein
VIRESKLVTKVYKNDVDLNPEAQSILPPGRIGGLFEEGKDWQGWNEFTLGVYAKAES